MAKIVGVRFERAGKIYHFEASKVRELKLGDWVVVRTSQGEEMGKVVLFAEGPPSEEQKEALQPVLRKATAWDLLEQERFRSLEPEALETCRKKVKELSLAMKVIRAKYNFNGSHLTFYFATETRVDFRQLVRELAQHFRTRIELKQVGVRDEAKLMGGMGLCGRPICCANFICEFSPISIRMAKTQNLPLNPMEISGLCGRLLCCLAYEDEFYRTEKEAMPKPGQLVITPEGPGTVVGFDILRRTVSVSLEGGIIRAFPADRLQRGANGAPPSA